MTKTQKKFLVCIVAGLCLTLFSGFIRGFIDPPKIAQYEYKKSQPETSQYRSSTPHTDMYDRCLEASVSLSSPKLYMRGSPVNYVSIYRYEANCSAENDELEVTLNFLAFVIDLALWSVAAFLVLHIVDLYRQSKSTPSSTPAVSKANESTKSTRLLYSATLLTGGVVSFILMLFLLVILDGVIIGEFHMIVILAAIILCAVWVLVTKRLLNKLRVVDDSLRKSVIKMIVVPISLVVVVNIFLFFTSYSGDFRTSGHDSLGFSMLAGTWTIIVYFVWLIAALGSIATIKIPKK